MTDEEQSGLGPRNAAPSDPNVSRSAYLDAAQAPFSAASQKAAALAAAATAAAIQIAATKPAPAPILPPRQAGPDDYKAAARILGCDPLVFKAVCLVESAGHGFDAQAFPTMLVEPHIIWAHATPTERRILAPLRLAYPRWGMFPYGSYKDQKVKFLTISKKTDENLAIMGTSFGLTQILGENYRDCACHSPMEFFGMMAATEAGQLTLTARLMISKHMATPLIEKRWMDIARLWNGPGQVVKYATKLASTYAALQKSYNPAQSKVSLGLFGDEASLDYPVIDDAREAGPFVPADLQIVGLWERLRMGFGL